MKMEEAPFYILCSNQIVTTASHVHPNRGLTPVVRELNLDQTLDQTLDQNQDEDG